MVEKESGINKTRGAQGGIVPPDSAPLIVPVVAEEIRL